jgi:8-oxo-dGTP pyrophosphatase MutT (NUDIX family)
MELKWRTVRSETLLKDRWIDLRSDHCVTPKGAEINPYYVMSYPDWVHVIGITDANKLVLVRQYRHAAGRSFLELPGGAAGPDDTDFEETARREFEEETGYMARQWEFVTTLHPNPATHTNRMHFFLALEATCKYEQRLDAGEEGLRVELVEIPAVLEGLRSGVLGQAMHVSGLILGLVAAGRLALAIT